MTLYDADGQEIKEIRLVGPSKGKFLDGDELFCNIRIGSVRNGVGIRIWESDPEPWRDNDMLYEKWIDLRNVRGLHLSWDINYLASEDARENALNRGANSWALDVWAPGGIEHGIPKLFVKILSF